MAVAAASISNDHAGAGLRTAIAILDKWGASVEQACRILRISRSTHSRAKLQRWSAALDTDQLQRISMVLNVHSALRLIFHNPENVYGFVSMANHNPFFNGRSPLDIMAQGDMISLYETFRRIIMLSQLKLVFQ